ncbi:MAG: cation diffusion facilitator family transporter [Sulfuricurvum sp.]|uniref:cation diffusion facilitator family transporter n=1 Tax=Sulfuricurvum sp. TaxID=2025608 RepID=UPI00272619B6|nr:cation diffusion facilitator family transporter [Sulfuricurvum sp.]MDO9056988.1 cation diffusion facilitator family transporter [Sulfuricurvum sp.]MDP3291869.1 cation diffusion facilitator family transporter [Sulfuricurvum sp.]
MSKSVKAALAANGIIAVAKGLAAFFTGSASMLAEAIHSTADCGNQALVLVGQKQAARGKSEAHSFGQGKANFFWSFVVAVVLFSLGGLFSLYEGIHKIMNPKEIQNPWLIVGIIILAVVLEGGALKIALKESGTKLKDIFKTIEKSSSSHILVVLIEDSGALLGLFILAVGLLLSLYVDPIFDGIAALMIGILLLSLSTLLFVELKKLLVGESLDRETIRQIKNLVKEESNVLVHINSVRSMFIGSEEVLLVISMNVKDDKLGSEIEQDIKELKHKIQKILPQHRLDIYIDVFEF